MLELGAGTGVFTRAMLARGLKERDLTLVEFRSDFARLLEHRFQEARVLRMDASRLAKERVFEGMPVGAVISGPAVRSTSSLTDRAARCHFL